MLQNNIEKICSQQNLSGRWSFRINGVQIIGVWIPEAPLSYTSIGINLFE